ncbi:MAG: hypothetical protein M5U34_24680 [Chloroflexi bacterium]|nr:hypothetical protein [Chloroflexota bacterium]
MKLGGYANKIAHVDLTSGTIEYKGMPEEWARKFIGGRGFGRQICVREWPGSRPAFSRKYPFAL